MEKRPVGRPRGKEKTNYPVRIEVDVLEFVKKKHPKLQSKVADFIRDLAED